MALECCVPDFGVGNAVDWAAVGVAAWTALIAALAAVIAIGGTAATVWVALLAHRTSKRAAEIAEEATKIAAQQHREAVQLREAQARILGRQVFYEVSALPRRVAALRKHWERSVILEAPMHIADGLKLLETLKEAALPLLPISQRLEDRIHNLPDSLGADLATLLGGSQTLSEIVRKIEERVKKPDALTGWEYKGDTADFGLLHYQLRWLEDLGKTFSSDFESFVLVSVDLSPPHAAQQQ